MIGLIDVGGTKLLAAVATGDTGPGLPVRRDTPQGDPIPTLIEMLDAVRGSEPLEAIAMAVPGPFDRAEARLLNPPGLSRAWWNLDLRGRLGGHFDCRVEIENDANCAALAEARHGAGSGRRTVVYFTVSTGIGTGVVDNGRLVIGRHDNEGGHMVVWPQWLGGPECECGGHGCLETLASGRAIARRFGASGAQLRDPTAWDEIGRWLGLAVVNATAMIDPDVVVFGGGVCHQWAFFEPALRRTVAEALHLQPAPAIVLAKLGEERNLYGALSLVTPAVPAAP